MAHRSFSLPALKLTKHNKSGSKSVSYLPRTTPNKSAPITPILQEVQFEGSDDQSSHQAFSDRVTETRMLEEPTTYELEMKASVIGWEQIRRKLLGAVVEGSGMYVNFCCNILQ